MSLAIFSSFFVTPEPSYVKNQFDESEVKNLGQAILKNQNWQSSTGFLETVSKLSPLNLAAFIQGLEIDLKDLEKSIKEKLSDNNEEAKDKRKKLISEKPYLKRLEPETIEQHFNNAFDHALHKSKYLTLPEQSSKIQYVEKNKPAIIRFLSNIVDIFILSFDLTSPSPYDRNVTLEIYKKFFQIPVLLTFFLQPFLIIPWKVYAVTMVIFGGVVFGVYAYRKWFRIFPEKPPYCQNVNKFVSDKHSNKIQGNDKEKDDVLALLNIPSRNAEKKPVMIIGDSGRGKTTLFCDIVQDANTENPPSILKNKKFAVLKASKLLSKSPHAPLADKVAEILYALEGFEKDTIIFIDEAHLLAGKKGFEEMKELMRTSGMQIIAATTWGEFDHKIKAADNDRSFRRSFNYVNFGKIDDTQLKTLLQEILSNAADKVSFSENVFEEIICLTNKNLLELSQPDKSIKFLEKAISDCLANFERYVPEGLIKKRYSLKELRNTNTRKVSNTSFSNEEQIDKLVEEILKLEKDQRECKFKAAQIQTLLKLRSEVDDQMFKDLYALVQNKDSKADIELQKRYLVSYFYLLPELKSLIDEQVKALHGKMDLHIDIQFIHKKFKEFELTEKRAYDESNGTTTD